MTVHAQTWMHSDASARSLALRRYQLALKHSLLAYIFGYFM
ncbi:hypothetical protein ADIMK_0148 [Marinobacterium lacunae]|uniref:Uncharacterized protein n=1 Tax=Marinobacterium lacunae TaxID=1232683 RepID=A0A081G4C1_9GAMM|nr:hypothetical protein ADIMK_0148 [Marinobacterium lacunae]